MGTIRVTAAELRNRAEELQSTNKELKDVIEQFELAVDRLHADWQGEASDAFSEMARQDKTNMENFTLAIDDFYQKLLMMANRYEITEHKNANIAKSRSY